MTNPEINRLNRYLTRLEESAEALRLRINRLKELDRHKAEAALQDSKAKLKAKKLAKEYSIEIEDEQKDFDRLAVWPPEPLRDQLDTYDGDHYVYDWTNALERVERYIQDLQKYGN
jgi:hypothetical protein